MNDLSKKWLQFLKVFWMIFWRLYLISFYVNIRSAWFAFVPAIVVSAVLVFGAGRTIIIGPIIQLITNRNKPGFTVFPYISGAPHVARRRGPVQKSNVITVPEAREIVEYSTALGTMTGYEPHALENVPVPQSPLMVGSPGSGLSYSGFSQSSISMGQQGEQNFAKALQMEGILDKCNSFWSVATPNENMQYMRDADIDCILASGHTLILIDIKNYPGGDVSYVDDGVSIYAIDNNTGKQVREAKKMSQQMSFVRDTMQGYAKQWGLNIKVEAFVVIMPSDRGSGRSSAFYPGSVPALMLPSMIQYLKRKTTTPMSSSYPNANHMLQSISQLVKH